MGEGDYPKADGDVLFGSEVETIRNHLAYNTDGEVVLMRNDSEENTSNTSYTKLKTLTVTKLPVFISGITQLRVSFETKHITGPNGNARVYINGVAQGTERVTTSSYVAFTEDLTIAAGDAVQLYVKHDFPYDVYVKNLRIIGVFTQPYTTSNP